MLGWAWATTSAVRICQNLDLCTTNTQRLRAITMGDVYQKICHVWRLECGSLTASCYKCTDSSDVDGMIYTRYQEWISLLLNYWTSIICHNSSSNQFVTSNFVQSSFNFYLKWFVTFFLKFLLVFIINSFSIKVFDLDIINEGTMHAQNKTTECLGMPYEQQTPSRHEPQWLLCSTTHITD